MSLSFSFNRASPLDGANEFSRLPIFHDVSDASPLNVPVWSPGPIGPGLSAPTEFTEWSRTTDHYSLGPSELDAGPGPVGVLDVNNDGFLDFVVADGIFPSRGDFSTVPIHILLNDGTGHFSDGTNSILGGDVPGTSHPTDTVIADFNGDGRPDLYQADHGWEDESGPHGGQNILLLSNGAHGMVNGTDRLPQVNDTTYSATAGDIDGDGDLDILVMNIHIDVLPYFLINDGSAHFTQAFDRLPAGIENIVGVGYYSASLLVDVNDDGAPDLILGGGGLNHPSLLLLNDGSGDFSDAALQPLPELPVEYGVQNVRACDVNGDGSPDLILTAYSGDFLRSYLQLLMNDGDGHFSDETATRLPQVPVDNGLPASASNVADFNADGFPDLLVKDGPANEQYPAIFLNDGAGYFIQFPDSGFDLSNSGPLGTKVFYPIDVDGDGRDEILATFKSGDYPIDEIEYFIFKQPQSAATETGGDDDDGFLGHDINETISGLGGDDVIFGAGGNDTAHGGDGNDYLNGGTGNDTLTGDANNDTLNGFDGNDSLSGGANNDVLIGGAGTDALDGGIGADTANYSESTGGVKVSLAAAGAQSVGGGQGSDTLVSIENLTGSAFADTLTGNTGNNVIAGGAGKDTIVGGDGADIFVYAAASDSTSKIFDKLQTVDLDADRFDVPGQVKKIDATIHTGALSGTGFDAKLSAAVDASHLKAHHAVLFTPDAGSFAGDTFLIVDLNGVAGYQAGEDLVMLLGGTTTGSLGVHDFI
jgi:Ca2+-binding RTX toxin-like protein